MRGLMAAITLASLANVPQANALNTDELVRFCKGQVGLQVKDAAEASCGGYIRGFVDGLIMGTVASGAYCPPENGLDADRARDIVLGYVAAHPETLGKEAAETSGVAIVEAFRCSKGPAKAK